MIQHFIHCIETHGRHVEYLKFFQTIVKAENQFIRKCQDMVMQELVNAGEDVLIFYNDKSSFNQFVEMMRADKKGSSDDENSQLKLVRGENWRGGCGKFRSKRGTRCDGRESVQ